MSLQGSLDTFALPDVLVLLASTKKSGELQVGGSRSQGGQAGELQGLLWFDDGRLVAHDVAGAPDAPTAVFELLRLSEGSFSFAGGNPPAAAEPVEIEPVLVEAQAFLTEWNEIERVVPSLHAWLDLAPEAPGARVSMRAEQWRLVVAIGGGCDVGSLVERIGHGELAGCRAIKELAEAGLVTVGAHQAARTADAVDDGSSAPVDFAAADPAGIDWQPPVTYDDPPSARDQAPAEMVETDPADLDGLVSLPTRAKRKTASRATPKEAAPMGTTLDEIAASAPRGSRMGEAQALARQLASLSDEPGEVERPTDVAVDGLDIEGVETDEDEPLNRGLLLKFLSSVRN